MNGISIGTVCIFGAGLCGLVLDPTQTLVPAGLVITAVVLAWKAGRDRQAVDSRLAVLEAGLDRNCRKLDHAIEMLTIMAGSKCGKDVKHE